MVVIQRNLEAFLFPLTYDPKLLSSERDAANPER
jgi:hypothetical protein